jgi:hypothetical protein
LKNLTPNKANESTNALDGFPFTAINNRFSFIHQNTLLIKYKASFLLKTRAEVKKWVHQYELTMKLLTKYDWQENQADKGSQAHQK